MTDMKDPDLPVRQPLGPVRPPAPRVVNPQQTARLLFDALRSAWPSNGFTVRPGGGGRSTLSLLRAAQHADPSSRPERGTRTGAPDHLVRWTDGQTLEVSWTDGPRHSEVDRVTSAYLGLDFDPASERIYLRETLLAGPRPHQLPRLVRFDVAGIRLHHRLSDTYQQQLKTCATAFQSTSGSPLVVTTPWGPFTGPVDRLTMFLSVFISPEQAQIAASLPIPDRRDYLARLT